MRDGAADDRWIAAEPAPPVFVREDDNRPVNVGRSQHAPDRRRRTPSSENAVLGDRFHDDPLAAVPGVEPRAPGLVPEQSREHVGQPGVVLQIAKRQPVRHLDVLVAERGDRDELLRTIGGNGRNRKALMMVKVLALALMPIASVSSAAAVKPGVRRKVRNV